VRLGVDGANTAFRDFLVERFVGLDGEEAFRLLRTGPLARDGRVGRREKGRKNGHEKQEWG